MKKCTFLSLLLTLSAAASAQQDYFFAIEADKSQPFSVRIQEKNFSSSADGYLLIGKLKDTVYELKVSFPKNAFPEQVFKVSVNKKDKGFQLKKTGDQTWSLYNWQTMELIAAQSGEEANVVVKSEGAAAKTAKPAANGFANMMAAVVNDNDVLKDRNKTAVTKETPKQTAPQTNPPTPDVTVAEPAKPATKVIQVTPEQPKAKDSTIAEPAKPSVVVPTPETVVKSTNDSTIAAPVNVQPKTGQAIQEETNLKDSTVAEPVKQSNKVVQPTQEPGIVVAKDSTIAVPAKPKTVQVTPTIDSVATSPKKLPSIQIVSDKQTDKGREIVYKAGDEESITVLIPIEEPVKQAPKAGMDSSATSKTGEEVGTRTEKSTGLLLATDLDLDKLRVQMMETATTDQRLMVAKKAFAAKSYATKQVKGLTELFYSEVFKFQFLEYAYPTISDKDAFKELASLFSQEYYLRKFQELVK